eukprot:symbB.v1.2.018760.t1/scaffold1510.1/size114631/4
MATQQREAGEVRLAKLENQLKTKDSFAKDVAKRLQLLSEDTGRRLKIKRETSVSPQCLGSWTSTELKDLKSGERPQSSLAVKVLAVLKRPGEVPVLAVCCDASGEFLVLSLYSTELPKLEQAVVPGRTILAVSEANLRQISVTTGSSATPLNYPCVAVGNPNEVTMISGAAPGWLQSLSTFRTLQQLRLEKENVTAALYSSGSPYLHGALQIRGNWLGCLEEETPENLGTLG